VRTRNLAEKAVDGEGGHRAKRSRGWVTSR
jgi:hypothetical protein